MVRRAGIGLAMAAAALLLPAPATAQECRVVEFSMTPTEDLQIVIWIEDGAGRYVDTAFITRTTGSYGMGNRPGIMDFRSGPWWPYGRRESTFPVWSHRHGLEWPRLIFQDEDDDDLSHALDDSSRERFFCRPIRPEEDLWDAVSCASTVWTDKGKFDRVARSKYPPRRDLTFDADRDDDDVAGFAALNPFDAVSRATPLGGAPFTTIWSIPSGLPDGAYVAWMEVAREFDQNAFYDFPPAPYPAWTEYGLPYRGQPSIVYRVDFEVSDGEAVASTADWIGYGSPDGSDGGLRPPDPTISTSPAGSGAARILPTVDGDGRYLLKVTTYGIPDYVAPAAAGAPSGHAVSSTSISASFTAPGDDGMEGTVTGYQVRYLAGGDMTEASWGEASEAVVQIVPAEPGTRHEFTVSGLLPQTNYQIGIRAFDECFNLGPIVTIEVTTPRPEAGEVDYCFIATAAYGSLLASEVTALRGFRDRALRSNLLGELVVEAYYTFGPLGARFIAPSETLRRAARELLAPAVAMARRTTERLPFLR
jgi:hypothetical protein